MEHWKQYPALFSFICPISNACMSVQQCQCLKFVICNAYALFCLIAIECTDQKKTAAAKTYESLQLQIWSMLKGFCTRPTDLSRVYFYSPYSTFIYNKARIIICRFTFLRKQNRVVVGVCLVNVYNFKAMYS